MKTQIISNTTVKVTEEDYCPSHLKNEFASLEDAVNYMKRNDVIYKSIRQGEIMITLEIEKTEEANENWYKNEMRLPGSSQTALPTAMYK